MEFFKPGEVRLPTEFDFKFFKDMCHDESIWKRRLNKKKIQVYTRSTESSRFKMLRVIAIFPDVSADTLYDILHDSDYRPTWDHTMREGHEICRVCANSTIDYYANFVLHRVWQAGTREYTIINHSVFHRKMPPRPEYVRALTIITGYHIIALSPNSCQMIYVTQNDPRGDIPAWAINLVATKVAPRILKGLHKAALQYPTWKAQHRPDFKPWRNPEQQSPNSIPLDPNDILSEPDYSMKKLDESHVNKEAAFREVGVSDHMSSNGDFGQDDDGEFE